MTKMSVGIKRRLNDVTVPDYDNLILKLVWILWVRLVKLTTSAEARKHFEILFGAFRR